MKLRITTGAIGNAVIVLIVYGAPIKGDAGFLLKLLSWLSIAAYVVAVAFDVKDWFVDRRKRQAVTLHFPEDGAR